MRHEGTLESFLDMKLIALKKYRPSRTQPETWIVRLNLSNYAANDC